MGAQSRSSWWWLMVLVLGAASIALLIVWIVVLVAVADGSSSSETKNAFGHLTALLILVLFTGVVQVMGRSVGGLVVGKDNRVSTSKLQVLIWTYAIAGALLSLIAATWVGADAGFDALTDDDFDFEAYLVLLGGPFAAAILSR